MSLKNRAGKCQDWAWRTIGKPPPHLAERLGHHHQRNFVTWRFLTTELHISRQITPKNAKLNAKASI